MRKRSCTSRRGRLSARLHSARIGKLPRSMRARSVSVTVCSPRSGPSSSVAAPPSATSRMRTTRRSRPGAPRSSATGRSATAAGRATRSVPCRRSFGVRAASRNPQRAGREAVAVLEQLPPGRELALAYCNLASLVGDVALSQRALELAERVGDIEIVVRALATLGFEGSLRGTSEGGEKLTRALELARRSGLTGPVGNTYVNARHRVRAHAGHTRPRPSTSMQASGTAASADSSSTVSISSRIGLDRSSIRGDGKTPPPPPRPFVRVPRASTMPRTVAQVVLGLVRARRGDPGWSAPLDEAWALSESTGESLRFGPAAAARAEAAWLEGRHDAVAGATQTALELAVREELPWMIGELAYWRWRAGIEEAVPDRAAEPYAAQIAGDWARAAELWTDLGCPYEAALALADADEEEPLRRALDELQRLGARPAAAIVARRLRARGATGLPRGPRPATGRNPAGLTEREMEVLALVARGLRNAEIARAPRRFREDGRSPRLRHLAEARRRNARPGERRGRPSRGRRPRPVGPAPYLGSPPDARGGVAPLPSRKLRTEGGR